MRVATIAALSAIAAGVACSDVTGVGELEPRMTAPATIDFGDVQLGVLTTREITVENTGQVSLVIDARPGQGFTADGHAFSVEPAQLALGPGRSAVLRVGFRAFRATPEPVSGVLDLDTDAELPGGTRLAKQVTLRGRGVQSALEIEPNPVDFGTVLVGSSRTLDVRITNRLALPVELSTPLDAMGRPQITSVSGRGRFTVLGSLSTLEPGASITVPVRYVPDVAAPAPVDRATWTLQSCPDPLCGVDVVLIGQGSDAALVCVPAAVDFGAVNPERRADRDVVCTNVASDGVEILGWSLDANSSPELTLEPSRTATLAPGAALTVRVSLSPPAGALGGAYAGTLVVRGRNLATRDGIAPSRVPLTGTAGGPRIAVLPSALTFGPIEVGTRDRRAVVIVNEGYDDLLVMARLEGDAAFGARTGGRMLAAGTATVVQVAFEPSSIGPARGRLVLASNDASAPETAVELSGEGVMVGPCTATIAPGAVSFGLVAVGERRAETVEIANTGSGTCIVQHVEVLGLAGTSSLAFSTTAPSSFTLGPRERRTITVEYEAQVAGPERGALELYVSDLQSSLRSVPLGGTGFSSTRVECPPPVTVDAGTQVSLELAATSRTGTITAYAWSITSAPVGGVGTPNQWSPDPPESRVELFRPYLVGLYDLRATVTDSDGLTATCTTAVTAIAHGLRVELTWDGFGDVDLHLHNANRTPWFGRGMTAGAEDDCFYANCSQSAVPVGPLWDPLSPPYEGRNPGLDFDNIVAFGPENIHVDDVRAGDTFTVALHYFWDHGFGPRIATTNIYCGPTAIPTATFTSTTMIGLDMGGCTENTFWKVATLTFTSSGACTVLPIDAYQTGRDACASF